MGLVALVRLHESMSSADDITLSAEPHVSGQAVHDQTDHLSPLAALLVTKFAHWYCWAIIVISWFYRMITRLLVSNDQTAQLAACAQQVSLFVGYWSVLVF